MGVGPEAGRLRREVEVVDPGPLFAAVAGGTVATEDAWQPPAQTYDLVLAIGTLDTVNDLPLALRLDPSCNAGQRLVPRRDVGRRHNSKAESGDARSRHGRRHGRTSCPSQDRSGRPCSSAGAGRLRIVPSSTSINHRIVSDIREADRRSAEDGRDQHTQFPSAALWARRALRAAKSAFEADQHDDRTEETFEILHCAAWTAIWLNGD